ncbi:MAG: chorismate synthase [Puniceicoccales bacterium]|jgi:chorismate synthase|nr:chorismate synthase [Puniceicoccales bacterium]
MGNTFGHIFCVTTFGESHGPAIGAVVDGCPPRIPLSADEIQRELDRRRPGQSALTTPRAEGDAVEILSGVYQGLTLGTPIALLVRNRDMHSSDYDALANVYRPSHADFTYQSKYGFRNPGGGGRASARETIARVAAGAIAAKILYCGAGVEIRAFVESVCDIAMPDTAEFPSRETIDATPVRCPHLPTANRMAARIGAARENGDSLGGVIRCRVRNVRAGLGQPVFDRLDAELARAMLSIPATKGFEIGDGFASAQRTGSENNDPFVVRDGKITTETNRSGGVQGGISTGGEIFFRVAFKPTPTIALAQRTVDAAGNPVALRARGRHDPCVLPRAVPIVEAMTALVLLDLWLLDSAQNKTFDHERLASA